MRARRFALTALCAGGTLGAAGLVAVPTQALAATQQCSDVYGSGSSLQTSIQQNIFSKDAGPDGAFDAVCNSPVPNVYYNTGVSGGAIPNGFSPGSGTGLTEFALQAPSGGGSAAVTPTESSNQSFLDSFIGTDDPPAPAAMSTSSSAAGSDPEPVPVVQAPISIIVNLPAGCTITTSPTFRNADLSLAFANDNSKHIGWTKLLTDAGAGPSGCGAKSPLPEVRADGSGTSFAFKQYLSQIDPATWSTGSTDYVSDASTWPGTVSREYVDANGNTDMNNGSGGEAAAVADTTGTIGYVNLANAVSAGITGYSSGSTLFFGKVQNNGKATTGTDRGAAPQTSSHAGNCPTTYSGKLPSGTTSMPNWTGVHVANPTQSVATIYPICTLTYDVAWQSYSSSVLAPDYTGNYNNETPAGVQVATKAYLGWVVDGASLTGQALIPAYYDKLPSTVDKVAKATIANEVGLS